MIQLETALWERYKDKKEPLELFKYRKNSLRASDMKKIAGPASVQKSWPLKFHNDGI